MTDLEIRKPYLSKRNTKILDLWNTGEHTYETIGDIFGVTRERIRQILAKAKKAGFIFHGKSDMVNCMYEYQYLYYLIKPE